MFECPQGLRDTNRSPRALLHVVGCCGLWALSFRDYLQQSVVPADLPSRRGDVAVYVFDINQPSLPTPFYSVLVCVSLFKALSTVFHSINSPNNSPLSHSVLLVLFLPYWSMQLYNSS